MSDAIITSSDKTDMKTHYINETTKKRISNANPRPTERLVLRKCAPRLGQKHFLTPRNAVQLPRKNSLIVSLYASFDRSRSSFNRARIALITVNCKIMHSTQGFPLFFEIACMRRLVQYTACSLRLETCPKHQFSKMSPAPRPKPLFDPTNCSKTIRKKPPSKAPLGHLMKLSLIHISEPTSLLSFCFVPREDDLGITSA